MAALPIFRIHLDGNKKA
ncbi:hypothetical protein [Escherichia coli]|nr:hypothetical protein [Escherichia coli]